MESEPARGLRWGLVLRAVVPVLLLALIGSVVVLVPDWMWTLPLDQRRRIIETFLRGVLVVYFLGLVAGSVGTPLLGWLAFRSWRRGQFRPWLGKTALACWGTLVALIGAEAGAAFWNAWVHRTPTLPTRFPEPTPAGQVRLAVLGESSAAGELYQPWLSVGKILAWQLQEAIPGTTYVAEVLAEPGVTLERMHQKLEGLRQRPDAVIVYCGHNEFQARFDWARRVGVSEVPSSRLLRALYEVSQRSPLCRLIYEQTTRARLDAPPMATPHDLIDSPICTPTETRGILEDFHNRLEAIVSYVEQIGAIPILVVPPGNEAGFEPNRSSLPGDTPAAESEGVRQMFKQASALEVTEPDRSLALYRDLVRSHPGLAEAHFRLGRLLQRFGSDAEARGCYERARDMDGFPQRCTTSLQKAYRQVASRHGCILIDGPAELRALNPHGLLDDTLFHDAQHPALRGHMALAEALLRELAQTERLGWPEGRAAPRLDPAACAAHFGIGQAQWAKVCERAAWFAGATASNRFDPTERLAKQRRYEEAARELNQGTEPEATGIPGLGTHPAPEVDPSWALQPREAAPAVRTAGAR